jgi:signal transduction histidine kinase
MLPIHPTKSVMSGGSGKSVLQGLHALLSAIDVDDCRKGITNIKLAVEECSGLSFDVAEIVSAPGGAEILWQTENLTGPFALHLAAWFQKARFHPGRCLAFGENMTGLIMAGEGSTYVVAVTDMVLPPPDLVEVMRDLAGIAAVQLQKLRPGKEPRLRRERLDGDAGRDSALVRASADLIWRAGADETIHVTTVLHGRRDLAKIVEGRALRSIVSSEKEFRLLRGNDCRRWCVSLPGFEKPLFFVACPDPDDMALLWGTIVVAPATEEKVIKASALEAIVAGRLREEQLRREAEVMVLGLRLILSDLPFHEKLEQLARHLARAIRCDEVRLVLSRHGETPSLLFPGEIEAATPALDCVAARGSQRMLTSLPVGDKDNTCISTGLNMPPGEILLVALPAETERYYILARGRHPLSNDDYGLVERMSLLLEQALFLQADQKRMIHGAKLSALGQMSTSIAHELRQPLNAISITAQNIEMMAEGGRLEPKVLQEKVVRILSQIDRATKVMDRMRRFGRKSGGDRKPVSLSAVVHSVRSLMDAITTTAGVTMDISVCEDHQIYADELEIEQVLVNLVQNAVDAIGTWDRNEARPGHIRVWSQDDSDDPSKLRLCIEDNGPGFTPETREHALDAFFTTKAEGKGTGLGLSITHTILREHGGQVLVGQGRVGALISLVLPRSGAQAHSLVRSDDGAGR